CRELPEPGPQPLQLPPPHRTLFGDAVAALGKDIEFTLLRQQLDLHAGSRLLPRLGDQMLLQTRQAPLRRAYQIMHRRVGRAHLCEYLFGRHAAVHQPDPARLAVLPLDAIEKSTQRRLVGRVAGQHFVGQRQTFGRHHQGNDDLHTIRPVIARIAEAALVALRKWRIGLERQYGKARRVWLMDRGVPTEEVLAEMRAADPPVHYLVGTPKGRLTRLEKHLVAQPWQEARPGVQVKLLAQQGELYV